LIYSVYIIQSFPRVFTRYNNAIHRAELVIYRSICIP